MRVWELLNELKGTDATLEQIKDWSYMNRVMPCELEVAINWEGEYPSALRQIRTKLCFELNGMSCLECWNRFFEEEVEI